MAMGEAKNMPPKNDFKKAHPFSLNAIFSWRCQKTSNKKMFNC
jgi:hypothetical protein